MYPDARFWVEIIAALTVPISIISVVWHRVKREMGMGIRAIQFLALGVLLPVILILGLEKVIEAGTVGTLLGAIVGYLFANIAKDSSGA
jgi:hypothetical protein